MFSRTVRFGNTPRPSGIAHTPARAFVYHVADGAARRFSLVLRSPTLAHVQLLGSIVGPSPAYTYVGQQSSARFLLARASQESVIVTLAAGVPYELPLGTLNPGDLVEAIEDLRVLDGGPVALAVVARSDPSAPLPAIDGPELADDTHGRRGTFALTSIPPIELAFAFGSTEPAPVQVGDLALPNLRAGGRPLSGDYGIVRPLALHLSNPTPNAQNVYLYELTNGSAGATATFWFAGDPAATLVPCVDDANQPHLIATFALAVGEMRTVRGTFMTDGASSYPLRLGLTATPPSPVAGGGCTAAPAR